MDVIKQSWREETHLQRRLERCNSNVRVWSKEVFRNNQRKIIAAKEQIEQLEIYVRTNEDDNEMQNLKTN